MTIPIIIKYNSVAINHSYFNEINESTMSLASKYDSAPPRPV